MNASYKRNVRLPKGKGEADEEKGKETQEKEAVPLGGSALQLLEVLELLALHKLVDAFEVLGDLPSTELVDLAHQAIEEVTVVRDEDERAIVVEERLLEDLLGLHIKVVRWFVEDQEVVRLEEELKEC